MRVTLDSLFGAGAESFARTPLRNARSALVNLDAALSGKRGAVVAPLAIPWSRDLVKKVGTRNPTGVIPSAAARPFLSPVARQLRQTAFELWHSDFSYSEGGDGRLGREVLVKARLFAWLPPVGRKNAGIHPGRS